LGVQCMFPTRAVLECANGKVLSRVNPAALCFFSRFCMRPCVCGYVRVSLCVLWCAACVCMSRAAAQSNATQMEARLAELSAQDRQSHARVASLQVCAFTVCVTARRLVRGAILPCVCKLGRLLVHRDVCADPACVSHACMPGPGLWGCGYARGGVWGCGDVPVCSWV
jgi:hypothetical protein